MTAAILALALSAPPQILKKVDIDRFDTPYTVNMGTGFASNDAHEWVGLAPQHCVFYRRATNIQVNANPNNTVLTFNLGQGLLSFSSPKQVSWEFNLYYFTADGTFIDLSRVKRFYLDCDHIPDIAVMFAYDKWFNSGSSGWGLYQGGIYFNRLGFGGNLDWKNIYNIRLRLDFASMPNPLSVNYSRLYVTLEPGLIGSGSKADPLGVGPGG